MPKSYPPDTFSMRITIATVSFALAVALCALSIPASTVAAGASIADVTQAAQGVDCGDLLTVGGDRCTHGGDHLTGELHMPANGATATLAASGGHPCPGDGESGPRIRAFYGYPSDTTSNASAYLPTIEESVAIADANLDAATPAKGGQHLRMFCKGDDEVTVTSLALRPIGDAAYTFEDVIDSLGDAGIDAPRFTYVVFVDNITCCYGPAGQGTLYWDDRAEPNVNFNNRLGSGPRFAMIEVSGSSETDAFRFLHELWHTLGSVQVSAPHSTGAGHCYTNVDLMCSFDGGSWFTGGGEMEQACPQPPPGEFTFDCRGRDYYDINPPAGSYLAKHWNTADSDWLTRPH